MDTSILLSHLLFMLHTQLLTRGYKKSNSIDVRNVKATLLDPNLACEYPGQNSDAVEVSEEMSLWFSYCAAQIILLTSKPHNISDVWITATWQWQQFMRVQQRKEFRVRTLGIFPKRLRTQSRDLLLCGKKVNQNNNLVSINILRFLM